MGFRAKTLRTKEFKGVKLETGVLDSASREYVNKVKAGAAYGQIVTIDKYEAMWPLPLRIKSSLADTKQLSFQLDGEAVAEWEWEVTLQPNREGGTREQVLLCGAQKIRKKDRLTVNATAHTNEEVLPLELRIE